MYTVLKLFWPFEGNCEADVAPGENEFDTSVLNIVVVRGEMSRKYLNY